MPRVGLQSVIVVYPDHTHLRFGLEGKGIPSLLVGVSMEVAASQDITTTSMKIRLLYTFCYITY